MISATFRSTRFFPGTEGFYAEQVGRFRRLLLVLGEFVSMVDLVGWFAALCSATLALPQVVRVNRLEF